MPETRDQRIAEWIREIHRLEAMEKGDHMDFTDRGGPERTLNTKLDELERRFVAQPTVAKSATVAPGVRECAERVLAEFDKPFRASDRNAALESLRQALAAPAPAMWTAEQILEALAEGNFGNNWDEYYADVMRYLRGERES